MKQHVYEYIYTPWKSRTNIYVLTFKAQFAGNNMSNGLVQQDVHYFGKPKWQKLGLMLGTISGSFEDVT